VAGQQTISGPVLNIPLLIYPSKTDAKPYRSVYHIMPETLEIKGDVQTEKRHRSIYEAVVFTTDLAVSGEFSVPAINIGETADVLWEEAYYSVGISDNRGIKGSVVLNTEDNQIEAVPGLREVDLFESGLTFPVNMNAGTKEITFSARCWDGKILFKHRSVNSMKAGFVRNEGEEAASRIIICTRSIRTLVETLHATSTSCISDT
jgi:inner membrane protein involved in colicin E2 resistance